MNKHNTYQDLNLLSHIQKVDAPPFLITRIQQTIVNAYRNRFSPRVAFSLAVAFALLIMLNAFILTTYNKQNKEQTNLVQSMNLMPRNTLYR